MKKIALLFALLLLLLTLPAYAAQDFHVYDEADLLTDDEEAKLSEMAADLSAQYDCGIHLAAVEDYTELSDARSIEAFAEEFYHENLLGFGAERNGILLILSMAERDYALIAHGDVGNSAFTDYGKDILSEEFLDNFSYDDWAGGFTDYLTVSEQMLQSAAEGKPVDVEQGSGVGLTLVMILLIPAAIAGIACACMAASMKTARMQTHADNYRGDVQLTGRNDRFITRTVVRQKIESSSSSSSSRGGTRVNSGGFSGKSGKF